MSENNSKTSVSRGPKLKKFQMALPSMKCRGRTNDPLTEIILPDVSECDAPGEVDFNKNCDFSIPIIFDRDQENNKIVRVRTKLDDVLLRRSFSKVPTNRAIQMANAIRMEELLTTGEFGSTSDFAKILGVSSSHVNRMLNMLNLPPDEIERILFETH